MSVRRGFPGSVPGPAAGPPQQTAALGARLAGGLKGLMGQAQTLCRLKRCAPDVQLHEHTSKDGSRRLSYSGVATCKSSLCPLCAPKWQQTRVSEIAFAVEHWQGAAARDWRRGAEVYGPRRDRTPGRRVMFATFTHRHHAGMPLVLQHRLLARAYGHLWSGRAGQALVKKLGGKPESVRAHDRTWSLENGWHPHLHALLFFQHDLTPDIEQELWHRWAGGAVFGPRRKGRAVRVPPPDVYGPRLPRWLRRERTTWKHVDAPGALVSALRSMKRFCAKTLARAEELEADPGLCWRSFVNDYAGRDLKSCPCLRCTSERARRMFGRLVPRMKQRDEWSANQLLDAVERVSALLDRIGEDELAPDRAHGVQCEPVRGTDKAPKYLAKLGLELAWHASKDVNRVHGVDHYPYWGVAHVATQHGNPLRKHARRAWAELFRATRGTQAIVFSDRKELGLGPDPYAAGKEPEEELSGELSRAIGLITGAKWDELRKAQSHGLLVTIAAAHEAATLPDLPWVQPPPTEWAGVPSTRGPPPKPYLPLELRQRRLRSEAREARGREWTAQVLKLQSRPEVDRQVWLEEIAHILRQAGVRLAPRWRLPYGHPW